MSTLPGPVALGGTGTSATASPPRLPWSLGPEGRGTVGWRPPGGLTWRLLHAPPWPALRAHSLPSLPRLRTCRPLSCPRALTPWSCYPSLRPHTPCLSPLAKLCDSLLPKSWARDCNPMAVEPRLGRLPPSHATGRPGTCHSRPRHYGHTRESAWVPPLLGTRRVAARKNFLKSKYDEATLLFRTLRPAPVLWAKHPHLSPLQLLPSTDHTQPPPSSPTVHLCSTTRLPSSVP